MDIFHKHNMRFKGEEGGSADLYRISVDKCAVVEAEDGKSMIHNVDWTTTNSMILKIVLEVFDILERQNTSNLIVDNPNR